MAQENIEIESKQGSGFSGFWLIVPPIALAWGIGLWVLLAPRAAVEHSSEPVRFRRKTTGQKRAALTIRLLKLCDKAERDEPGASFRLKQAVSHIDEGQLRVFLERAVAFSMAHPDCFAYHPSLLEFRHKAFLLFKDDLKIPAKADRALELYCTVFLTDCCRAWVNGVAPAEKRALFALLTLGLDKNPSNPELGVIREAALGLVQRLEDPASLPYLEKMAELETHLDTRWTAAGLIRRLRLKRRTNGS